ncbi:MAG: hypothetical protein R3C52_10480 [Hyphomonadaceae bacterium]
MQSPPQSTAIELLRTIMIEEIEALHDQAIISWPSNPSLAESWLTQMRQTCDRLASLGAALQLVALHED